MPKIQVTRDVWPINQVPPQVIFIDLYKHQDIIMEAANTILCWSITLHRNSRTKRIVVFVNLVAVKKMVTKYLTLFKPFGHHLYAWFLVPPLRFWLLQIVQHPVCSHHEHAVVRLLDIHNVVSIPTNDIGYCIHVANFLFLYVLNNLLCRHPLWPVFPFLNQCQPK